jgi:hypothetical protein
MCLFWRSWRENKQLYFLMRPTRICMARCVQVSLYGCMQTEKGNTTTLPAQGSPWPSAHRFFLIWPYELLSIFFNCPELFMIFSTK